MTLLRVIVFLFITRIALSILSLSKFRRFTDRIRLDTQVSNFEAHVNWIKKFQNKFPKIFTCLVSSATLKILIGNKSHVDIYFGVKSEPTFEAHSWLDLDGNTILGEEFKHEYKVLWKW